MNFCINCRFYQPAERVGSAAADFAKCIRNGTIKTNLVTGEQTLEYPYCDLERKYETKPNSFFPSCGKDGRNFEPKQASEEAPQEIDPIYRGDFKHVTKIPDLTARLPSVEAVT